jgi:four helix bundle protein
VDKEYGHKKMKVWQNADKLDIFVQQFLRRIPRHEARLREQVDSSSGSITANFVEGYYSGSLPEYIKFIRYSKRSCGELNEHIRRVNRKGYILDNEYALFDQLAGRTMYLFNRLLYALENKLKGSPKHANKPN